MVRMSASSDEKLSSISWKGEKAGVQIWRLQFNRHLTSLTFEVTKYHSKHIFSFMMSLHVLGYMPMPTYGWLLSWAHVSISTWLFIQLPKSWLKAWEGVLGSWICSQWLKAWWVGPWTQSTFYSHRIYLPGVTTSWKWHHEADSLIMGGAHWWLN